ncbi:signal peptidase II [Myxococcota bacterium]
MRRPRFCCTTKMAVFLGIASMVAGCDQATKWQALAHLTDVFEVGSSSGSELDLGEKVSRFLWSRHPRQRAAVSVLDDFWHFRYVENPDAIWSLFRDAPKSWRVPFLLAMSLTVMIFVVLYARRLEPHRVWERYGLALVLGGAMGNFVDRARLGYVIDFVDWHWYHQARWPVFNLADAAIVIGVSIMLAARFRSDGRFAMTRVR